MSSFHDGVALRIEVTRKKGSNRCANGVMDPYEVSFSVMREINAVLIRLPGDRITWRAGGADSARSIHGFSPRSGECRYSSMARLPHGGGCE